MQVVVQSLFETLPAIATVAIIMLLFLLIFGILGVQLFAGRFAARAALAQIEPLTSVVVERARGGVWEVRGCGVGGIHLQPPPWTASCGVCW